MKPSLDTQLLTTADTPLLHLHVYSPSLVFNVCVVVLLASFPWFTRLFRIGFAFGALGKWGLK